MRRIGGFTGNDAADFNGFDRARTLPIPLKLVVGLQCSIGDQEGPHDFAAAINRVSPGELAVALAVFRVGFRQWENFPQPGRLECAGWLLGPNQLSLTTYLD